MTLHVIVHGFHSSYNIFDSAAGVFRSSNRCTIRILFDDTDIYTKSEDYTVYIKSDKDLKLNLLTRDKYTIVKIGIQMLCEASKLKPNFIMM